VHHKERAFATGNRPDFGYTLKIVGIAGQKSVKFWLILGPSGAGKSYFGKWLSSERDWLHLEIDLWGIDGINENKLRSEWDSFYNGTKVRPLGEVLQNRLDVSAKQRGVLTFPGNLILTTGHIAAAARAGMRIIYLYGSAANCITEFLDREQKNPRNIGINHWMQHNCYSYMQMSVPDLAASRIDVFTHQGTRRPCAEIYDTLLMGERSH
jgi:shikimate kinase